LSLLVNQFGPWYRCVFHGNNKVHKANEALKQVGFAFLSYVEQGARSLSFFYNCGRYFAGKPLPSYWRFFLSLIKRKY